MQRKLFLLTGAVIFLSLFQLPEAKRNQDRWFESLSPDERARVVKKLGQKGSSYDEPAEAQEFYHLRRSRDGVSPISPQRIVEAIERADQMPQYSTALNAFYPPKKQLSKQAKSYMALGAWTQLGPGNIGGRTRALLVDPNVPDTMYAAGVGGGVWKTTDGGMAWTALADLLPNIAFASLAFDPKNSSVIYAGTGEGFFNGDATRGMGIFKTTDAGTTWSLLQSTETEDFHFVNDLIVSHNNALCVYAGTRTGVWRSEDGGLSWTKILDPLDGFGETIIGGCLDLAIRTDQATDYLFASCGTFDQATVYRNANAGSNDTWEAVLSEANMGRTSLAIAPSNQNIVYALAASNESGRFQDGLLAVFRSDDSGEVNTWTARVRNTNPTKLNTVLLTNPLIAHQSECNNNTNSFANQGWYDNVIAVDPVDPNRVWVGGIDLFRSDDGGQSWGLASYWWADRSNSRYAHADNHTIVFHPQFDGTTNRVMFVGSDGGVFRTDNARAATATGSTAPCSTANSAVRWRGLSNHYAVTQFYFGLPYPNGSTYLGGTQDNGTLRGTDAAGINGWNEVFGGDGGWVAIDPTNPNTFFVETTRLSIRRTDDNGASFQSAISGINEPNSNFLFINSFVMDPRIPQRLWTGGRTVWRTNDSGNFWTQANSGVTGRVSAIAVSPSDSNRLLVGTSSGIIYRTDSALTSNANTTWPSALPEFGFVSAIAFDPADSNIAYATYSTFDSNHVFKSTDGGASWVSIDGAGNTGIPDIPVNAIVVDPNNSQRLYIGTDIGVFSTRDGGANWMRENSGFANVPTYGLAIGTFSGNQTLYAFTHGRGVWRVPLGAAPLKILAASVSGKKLLIHGQNFDSGSKVFVNGIEQKTKIDAANVSTNIIGKKAGKNIRQGDTVIISVRRSTGEFTPDFSYTRP